MADTRIVSGGQNETPITALHVRALTRANAIPVLLVNISGDVYNALGAGGAASNVNLNQVAGTSTDVNAGNASAGTLRVVVATDQPTVPVSIAGTVNVSGTSSANPVGISGDVLLRGGNAVAVKVDGSAVTQPVSFPGGVTIGAATAPIGISGDVLVRGGNAVAVKVDGSAVTQPVSFPGGISIGAVTAPVGVTGDVSTKPLAGQTWPVSIAASVPVTFSGQVGVNVVGGSIGAQVQPSGDFPVRLAVATAPIGITGDVSTTPKAGQTWPVREQGVVGVQVIGGGTNRVSVSGDQLSVVQQGAWGVAVTGDVLLRANPNTNIGTVTIATPIGVQVLNPGGRVSISGDTLNVVQQGAWAVAVTGDVSVAVTIGDIITVGNVVGSQIVGGSIGGRVSISGDSLNVVQQGVVGVQIVGGQSGGSTGVSGDVQTKQAGAWSVAVSGDVLLRAGGPTIPVSVSGPVGVQIVGGQSGGSTGISGDVQTKQAGAWAVAVTGDVLLRAGGPTIPVSVSGPVGVQVVGGGLGGAVGISGDVYVNQRGAWATAITGDVLLRANPNVVIGQIGNTIGVNVIGGSIGARISASGDLSVIPSTTVFTRFPVSGDTRLIDGVDQSIKGTVRSYTRANPLTVVLVNTSGDAYASSNDQPLLLNKAGRVAAAGSNSILAAVAGRRIKVVSYSLQGDGNNSRGFFASGASGTQLTTEWELAAREGIVKQLNANGGEFLFATTAGAALSFESSSTQAMKYDITYQTDDDA